MQQRDVVGTNLAFDRRTLLRRGALVGAGVLWAAPTVQSIALPAFAGTPVDEPPGDEPTEGRAALSYIAVLVQDADGNKYPFKIERNGGSCSVQAGAGQTPCCTPPSGWANPGTEVPSLPGSVQVVSCGEFCIRFTIPDGTTLAGVTAMGAGGEEGQGPGQGCGSSPRSFCVYSAQSLGNNTYEVCSPA